MPQLKDALCASQGCNGSLPVSFRPSACRKTSDPAAHRAAQGACLLLTPQSPPAAEPDGKTRSECPAAVPSTQPREGMRQTAQGPAACGGGSARTRESADRAEQHARHMASMKAWQAARAELRRQWHMHLTAREAVDAAIAAAALQSAELWAATEERMRAARLQSYPLPRRITLSYMEAAVKALSCSWRAQKIVGDRVREGFVEALDDVDWVQESCLSLVSAAHLAGQVKAMAHPCCLAAASCDSRRGCLTLCACHQVWAVGRPSMANGQAWCLEFLEACAGVHAAQVLADGHLEGALRRVDNIDEAMDELWDELEGRSMAPGSVGIPLIATYAYSH